MIWSYIAWGAFILVQGAANTFVSRARNSGSYQLHAYASLASNGLWISQQFVSLGLILDAIAGFKHGDYFRPVLLVGFYCLMSVSGSVGMHYIQRTYIEHGNRKVGA